MSHPLSEIITRRLDEIALSNPTDLKVGDWIQWSGPGNPTQVWKVDKAANRFWASDLGGYATMDGHGYTVVPAPKGVAS